MRTETKRLPKGLVELSITVSVDELRPHLEAAAQALAQVSKIEGFRPGKTPYALVSARVGEGKIYEAAADAAIRSSYAQAARAEGIKAIDEPVVAVRQLAPGNPLIYTATVPVLPAVTRLADYRALRIAPKSAAVADDAVFRVLRDLQKMQSRETAVLRPAGTADKLVVNISLSRDMVPIEGGAARWHQVYLNEPYYVPGFIEAVIGLKKGDKKSFPLTFPADHFQKTLAGKRVDFDVEVTDVLEVRPPELDDAFAASFGQKTLADLRELLKKNLAAEALHKETQRQEIAALTALVLGSSFEDIPEALINREIERMMSELKEEVARRNMPFDDYLAAIKKSRPELALGFAPQALQRIKTALAVRAVSEREGLQPSEQEVADEITRRANEPAGDALAHADIKSHEFGETVRALLRNRKVVEFLRDLAVR